MLTPHPYPYLNARPIPEMLFEAKSRDAITSSENSLEEKQSYEDKGKAHIDALIYANSLVPFIHLPPPLPQKKEVPPKRAPRKGPPQPSAATVFGASSMKNKRMANSDDKAAKEVKKARTAPSNVSINSYSQGSHGAQSAESVVNVLLTLGRSCS